MDGYVSVFGVKWPSPGTFGIILTLVLLLSCLIVYLIYKYLETREQTRIHNYQLFLFQAKHKGLNNFQFKILKNMASYLKLSNPKELVTDSALFESILSDFIEYLKNQTDGAEHMAAIFRDLATIYERLYIAGSHRKQLESMKDIEDGEILYFTTDAGDIYLGKVSGRGGDHLAVKLFTLTKYLGFIEKGMHVALHLLRINDAEYLINTAVAGVEGDELLVSFSDDFTKEREFRHPYVNVVIPAIVTVDSPDGMTEPEIIEGTILKINEYECVMRISSHLSYGREYPVSFEINKYKFVVDSRIVSLKTVETENVYYLTFKFIRMSDAGKVILTRYISESV